uniref:Immunoglobulin domain-containing protein n=1 Tax=Xiphophorus couchianus TaxID=32473 RepID=A0A3B5KQ37_9TELE
SRKPPAQIPSAAALTRLVETLRRSRANREQEGSVTISCPYDSQSVNKLKFLCRGNRPSTCRQQAVITSSNTQNGRFRLSDDRKSRIFTVTISSLTLKDSGSYLCGVQRISGFDVFSAVELKVKVMKRSRVMHGRVSGSENPEGRVRDRQGSATGLSTAEGLGKNLWSKTGRIRNQKTL